MFPEQRKGPSEHSKKHRQRGVGLPLAIFIITVLALIILAMTQLQQGTAEMEIQDLQSARAFYVAESGAQASLALLFPVTGSAASCAASMYQTTFTTPGISNCSVTVDCSSQSFGSDTYYTLRSEGVCGQGTEQARRIIEVKAR